MPFRMVDGAVLLDLLKQWSSSDENFKRILVDNAARFYGF